MCAWWRHQMETISALLAFCAGNSPHKGQWRGALMFSLICARINGWVNNREAGDLRRHRAHYDVIVMNAVEKISGKTMKFRFSIRGKVAFCCLYRFHMLCIDGLSAQWGIHDDVIKWKPFPHYWPFVSGIHRSLLDSPHKGRWRGALMFSLISAWTDGWTNNRDSGDYKATAMSIDNSFELL